MRNPNRRIAIVHDWLTSFGGAERVLEQILILYPTADLFCVCDFIDTPDRGFLRGVKPKTSFIQHLPLAKRQYRSYLPLMPLAVEQFDLSSYDLVISSSHAVAKGVITGPGQLHVSYVHSPIRYAWDLQHQYLRESRLDRGLKSWIAKWLLHKIRIWDLRTANGVDHFIANSEFIAQRIEKVYRRKSVVIYPPVDVTQFQPQRGKEDFFLTASRLVPYKKIDLIAKAFANLPQKKLKIIGSGPDQKKIQMIAKNASNIEFLGYQNTDSLIRHMCRARAFIFAAEEDFGIVSVEAQACGTPVIAYGKGGSGETVLAGRTGILYFSQTVSAILGALAEFEKKESLFEANKIRAHALGFAADRFRAEFSAQIEQLWEKFSKRSSGQPASQ